MKKTTYVLSCLLAAACLIVTPICASAGETQPVSVKIAALKGPTSMGLVQMMDQADQGSFEDAAYSFHIAGAVDEVTAMVAKGEADIAAVPANLAAVLYKNLEGSVEAFCVNTLGVIYILDHTEDAIAVQDLKGKTLYASGKGATPEYALDYILRQNGLDPEADLQIEWKSEHAECLAAFLADESSLAMLPQPFVTTAEMKNEGIHTVLSLTDEWDRLQADEENPSAMITGVAIVRKDFAQENPEAMKALMERYEASVQFSLEHPEEAAALIGQYDIVPEQVAVKALPYCNITFLQGEEMKTLLSGYLQVLYDQNPAAVGGALPDDGFYYENAD